MIGMLLLRSKVCQRLPQAPRSSHDKSKGSIFKRLAQIAGTETLSHVTPYKEDTPALLHKLRTVKQTLPFTLGYLPAHS
jgi:hypothetical protein